jgi:hypothetical protein
MRGRVIKNEPNAGYGTSVRKRKDKRIASVSPVNVDSCDQPLAATESCCTFFVRPGALLVITYAKKKTI